MERLKNFFATRAGIVLTGLFIGILAAVLQKLGNPPNMGICVACMERDIAGALGLHRAEVVQYMRPEIIGFVLGAFLSALIFKEYRPRGGSSPFIRFILGIFAMIGALTFLGCPWRTLLRLAGGDGNAIFGFLGLIFGIFLGTRFFKMGYSLGRTQSFPSKAAGIWFPLLMFLFLVLLLLDVYYQTNILFFSIKGPGSMHAPIFISLSIGIFIGFIAQRSRFCTMGAFRDLILFKQPHLFLGVLSLFVAAFITNLILDQFNPGFENQPIAHTMQLWNFLGMTLAGLAFALAGGCPGRQLFLSGEGDGDAAIFATGMIIGAAISHNFGIAASPKGIGPHTPEAIILGFIVCFIIGFTMREKRI
ncbi:MAG: YedE-related selenium metabolism membrane protein [Thermodesulfobacterium geofontis]|uniref:YedE-related selenium metabolism membrane protein n=1 Tax=Thermodesulfobacterium geofontis TaxID=1295609 RepID=A0A2N7PME7_9BACT|nr:MAG: YedE-related selenium metabolism membrane protein [Thermodesulfobacterium geofontis]